MFWWLIENGRSVDEARSLLLLLFVLFENLQTFSSRSERRSVFSIPIGANPLLFAGVVGSQALHMIAMQLPILRDTLALQPVPASDWAIMLAIAASILVVMEVDKAWARSRTKGIRT